jgi:hypothetical protein
LPHGEHQRDGIGDPSDRIHRVVDARLIGVCAIDDRFENAAGMAITGSFDVYKISFDQILRR